MSQSSDNILPFVGLIKPNNKFNKVVFPDPVGPIIPKFFQLLL